MLIHNQCGHISNAPTRSQGVHVDGCACLFVATVQDACKCMYTVCVLIHAWAYVILNVSSTIEARSWDCLIGCRTGVQLDDHSALWCVCQPWQSEKAPDSQKDRGETDASVFVMICVDASIDQRHWQVSPSSMAPWDAWESTQVKVTTAVTQPVKNVSVRQVWGAVQSQHRMIEMCQSP